MCFEWQVVKTVITVFNKSEWRKESESDSCSALYCSLRPHGLYITWNSSGQNTWVAFSFSRVSSQPRDWTQVFHIADGFFTSWATREAQEYSSQPWNQSRVSWIAGRFFTNWAIRKALMKGFLSGANGREPACQWRRHEMSVRSLCWEDHLEEAMATHSSILAWRIPWTEEPDGLESTGSQRVRLDLALTQMKEE